MIALSSRVGESGRGPPAEDGAHRGVGTAVVSSKGPSLSPPVQASLAELVRSRRVELRLTQREAAAAAGVSVATWQSLERTDTRQRFQDLTLSAAAQALGLPVAEVFAAAGRAVTASVEDAVSDLFPGVARLVTLLRRLGGQSNEDLELVTRQAEELATYLLERPQAASVPQ